MDGSNDETVEIGMNEERRLCRLAGDDDDDDLLEDREALFGHRIDDPIDVDGEGAEPNGTEPDGDEPGSEEPGAKRKCPSTSPIWDDFQKLIKVVDGREVRYGAHCLHCSKEYSALSTGGTGHLSRHLKTCVKKREKSRMTQTQISFNPDGSMHSWDYCPLVAHFQLVRLIARLDIPISLLVKLMLLKNT
jgi:hypothetical protein